MRYSSQIRIRIVILMTKSEPATAVRRTLQRENVSDIPTERTIRYIYDKFLETGSVEDRQRLGRPSSVTEEKEEEIAKALAKTPMASIRRLSRESEYVKIAGSSYDALCVEVEAVQNAFDSTSL